MICCLSLQSCGVCEKIETQSKGARATDKQYDFKAGDIVCHFKRGMLSAQELESSPNRYLYEIVGVALHSETREPLMVYRALYDSCGLYVRPLEMFTSRVDAEKYPTARQKYRFEKYDGAVFDAEEKA